MLINILYVFGTKFPRYIAFRIGTWPNDLKVSLEKAKHFVPLPTEDLSNFGLIIGFLLT